jgi:hypothetical protein
MHTNSNRSPTVKYQTLFHWGTVAMPLLIGTQASSTFPQILLKLNILLWDILTILQIFLNTNCNERTFSEQAHDTQHIITNSTKSPSQKSDPLDRFFWKSIPSMLLLLLTTSQSFVYNHQQMKALSRRQHIMTQIQLSPPPQKVIPLTDYSENQSHPCFYYYWQLPKVSCIFIFINKCRRYPGDNILWHKFN